MRCISNRSIPFLLHAPGLSRFSCHRTRSFPRRFHASPPYRVLNEALQLSHEVFQAVHSHSGLSWALSIPLTAILFRLAYVPVQYFANRRQQSVKEYTPLLVAWRTQLQIQARQKFKEQTVAAAQASESWVQERLRARLADFQKNMDVIDHYIIGGMTLSFLPVWIVNIDVVRRMAGQENSLLGSLTDPNVIRPEPSFAFEGFLWFPDLTIADPLLVLPIAFGTVQLANWYFAIGQNVKRNAVADFKPKTGVQRFTKQLSEAISPVLFSMALIAPVVLISNEVASGTVLYILASATAMLVQRPVLKKAMGLTEMVQPSRVIAPKAKVRGK